MSYKVAPVSAANNKVTWFSDSPGVAVVDYSGVVTAVGEGMATITVTTEDGRRTASCAVTVSGISMARLLLF
ncbi:MAG: Ig-like domain-containing protein [Firmicutes bacterium]|nr:Ig-like domain-containing protein [Bacillota bacterium]